MPVRSAYRAVAGVGREPTPEVRDPSRRVIPGLRTAVAGSVAGKAIEMVTLLMLATMVPRALGPADYGHFAVLLTIVTVGSLALTLGGPVLMTRFVPAAPLGEQVALARALGFRLARGRAVQLAVLGVATVVVVAWQPERFPPGTAALVSVAVALNVAASLALQVTLGLGRSGPWSARFPLQNGVLVVAVLILHPVAGPTGAAVALVAAAVAAAVLAVAALAPVLREPGSPVPVPPAAIRFGTLHAAAAALVQVSQRGGVLAVALLAGSPVQTGYASLAIGIALGATYAVVQAFTVALPHLTAGSATAPADPEQAEAALRRLAGGLLVVLVPGAAAAALVLDVVVPRLFGAGYDGAVTAFGPALAVVVLAPLHSLAVQASALRLRPEAALSGGVAAAAAFVAVALVAVPAWGASGGTAAALAAATAGIATTLRGLPGASGRLVPAVSCAGAAAVLALVAVA